MSFRLAASGMFVLSFSALAFEVALVRICGVLLNYHLSFAVVSMAVLGVGIGGFAAYAATRRAPESALAWAGVALVAMPVGILLALVVLLRLPFAAHWPFLIFGVLPAFAAAGGYQSLMLQRWSDRAGRLYAADLAGGALGALAAVVALGPVRGPVNFALALAIFVAAFAWIWMRGRGRAARLAPLTLLLAGAVAALQGIAGPLDVSYERAPLKLISRMMRPTSQGTPRLVPELERWNAYSRVDVVELASPAGVRRLVFMDGETPTPMLKAGDPMAPNFAGVRLHEALAALPLRLRLPHTVLSIGSGGGHDVFLGRAFGVTTIDAVELDGGVLSVVDAARDFTGDVYRMAGVRLHHDEGRLFARRAPAASWDLVILALAQSMAGNLQEFALSTNFLYTREALADYCRVLRPGGSAVFLLNNQMAYEKLWRTALGVLSDAGRPAEECVVAVANAKEVPYTHLVWMSLQPFSAAERAALEREVAERGYEVLHLPGRPIPEGPERWSLAGSPAQFHQRPATDDRPFFFHMEQGTPYGLRLLLVVGVAALVVAWGALAVVWRRANRAAEDPGTGARGGFLAVGGYFVLLGLAFLMVEVLVLQRAVRVVGFPTLNLGLVLATFLVAAGCGSAASERLHRRTALGTVLVGLGVATLVLLPLLSAVQAPLERLPLVPRCLALVALLFPFGFLMGMPFPAGIRLLPARARVFVPWLWGLNGVASIVGSALVIAVMLEAGFRITGILPAALYALAAVAVRRFEPEAMASPHFSVADAAQGERLPGA